MAATSDSSPPRLRQQSAPATPTADASTTTPRQQQSTRQSFLYITLIFALSLLSLFYVYSTLPPMSVEERSHFHLPANIDDAKQLGLVLGRYSADNSAKVFCGYFITYVFLQSFAIPGSIFLSILSGYIFPFPLAIVTVCTCSAIGASVCYLLSALVGRPLVQRYWPERVRQWSLHVARHRHHLLNYVIFLRITPFLPNWFINIASPVIGVPLRTFFVGTFIGVAPPSFVAIQAGQTLQQLTSSGEIFTWTTMAVLCGIALLALLPVLAPKLIGGSGRRLSSQGVE